MPFSLGMFDKRIAAFIKDLKPLRVLDVGAGAGKYYDLVNKNAPSKCKIECVEPDSDYIQKYHLSKYYDRVYQTTIQEFAERLRGSDEIYDLVILGDVLEHLKKSGGFDVINFFLYRTKYILIVTPVCYIQHNYIDMEGGNHPLENHISVWGISDLTEWIEEYDKKSNFHFFILKGFL